jgi:hypothetical protein
MLMITFIADVNHIKHMHVKHNLFIIIHSYYVDALCTWVEYCCLICNWHHFSLSFNNFFLAFPKKKNSHTILNPDRNIQWMRNINTCLPFSFFKTLCWSSPHPIDFLWYIAGSDEGAGALPPQIHSSMSLIIVHLHPHLWDIILLGILLIQLLLCYMMNIWIKR